MLTCLIFTVPDRSWITESVKKYLGGKKKNMYRKDSEGWLKHADFMVLDMIACSWHLFWRMRFVGKE